MPTAPPSLICDFLEWLQVRPRTYAEAMEAWRTSCPRLTVWEDAVDARLVARTVREGSAPIVEVTSLGVDWLRQERRGRAVGPDQELWT